VLVVSWITADCDLHHNFRVKKNYSGTLPHSASRATDHEKFFAAEMTGAHRRERHFMPLFRSAHRIRHQSSGIGIDSEVCLEARQAAICNRRGHLSSGLPFAGDEPVLAARCAFF
jgi:hypothetical protein